MPYTPPLKAPPGERIQLLDALRGLSILLVVAYHFGYDLVVAGILPYEILANPVLAFFQPFFAGLFILLAGVSSQLSKNNLKRALVLTAAALLVTAASLFAGSLITFGILHLLTACVLLYALLEKLRLTLPAVLLAGFLLSYFEITRFPVVASADYFPIVPWGFLFFFGVFLGVPIKQGKFPDWFYSLSIPVFPWIGRRTLLIYLLHQPVLLGVVWAVTR
ncbi:MAG: DUF1624 domain-containing protein [Oscillospiraceae bacterium]|nr:DUF1624 domain-containing protein [Oscillospiraceae bacterium]